jgi:hypothetical protein
MMLGEARGLAPRASPSIVYPDFPRVRKML